MGLTVLISCIIILLIGIWFINRKRRMTILERHGIACIPNKHLIFGNIYELSGNKHGNNVKIYDDYLEKYGSIHGHYIGAKPLVVVKDPELLKLIQIKDFHLFSNRNTLIEGGFHPDDRSMSSLILLNDERWKTIRTILRGTFSSLKLKKLIPIVEDSIDQLISNIEEKSKTGDDFDIYILYQALTMDTIGRCAFGVKTDIQNKTNDEFLLALQSVFNQKISNPLYALGMFFPELDFIFYRMRKFLASLPGQPIRYLFTICDQIVETRRSLGEKGRRSDLLQEMLDARMTSDQISKNENLEINSDVEEKEAEEISIKSTRGYKNMTDDEIIANSILFFEAGYETTSTALGFITHILVNHQNVQKKVRQEVKKLLESQGVLNYNTVTELNYMEAVVNESLRIYPPVTLFVTRKASVDYKYKDITIPKGVGVLIPVYQLHHDGRYWPDPEKFDPERFMGINRGKVNPVIWQPFGTGPRNCVGLRFAMLEIKLALAKILIKYRLQPGPRTEIGNLQVDWKLITETPKNGVFVKATPL